MRGRTDVIEPAPPRAGGENGGRGRWAWLVTARNVYEAELLRGMLENAGVPVMLDGFDRSPFAWMYPAGNVNAPVQLFVPATLLDAARLELLESSLVASGRLAADAGRTDPGEHRRRLLRDRIRPAWLIVAITTSLAVAWFVIAEVVGFAPCSARLLCIGNEPDRSSQCGAIGRAGQAGLECPANP